MTNETTVSTSDGKSAIVIFDSRYGNTEKIATALAKGLLATGFQTDCVNAKEVDPASLGKYRFIAVGAPTEMITASRSIKEFLGKLKDQNLTGKFGFAFDTKLSSPLSGSAARYIEKQLKKDGLEIIMPACSAIVVSQKETKGSVVLQDGEEPKFEKIGTELGSELAKKATLITP